MKALIFLWVFVILSAVCKAVKDTLQFHFYDSIFDKCNHQFWNPDVSWKNKYKDGEIGVPKFCGSTTLFVWLTDAWHLFDMLGILFMFFACFFTVLSDFKTWAIYLSIFILFAAVMISSRVTEEIFDVISSIETSVLRRICIV